MAQILISGFFSNTHSNKTLLAHGIRYIKSFFKYAFVDGHCKTKEQYDASITRLYHTIEKGLSYEDYRAGFGKPNVKFLLKSLEEYSDKFGCDDFTYRTALSCLKEYKRKNIEYGYKDDVINKRIENLKGDSNELGGTITIENNTSAIRSMNYEEFVKSRHSVRHFSTEPVKKEAIEKAIGLAQHTPSACNRQGWRTIVVEDKNVLENILKNQNGNRGFGQEIDKMLLVVADLRAQQKSRELHQVFIDGGMYAQSVLMALHYEGIATIPLSASLNTKQERNIRKFLNLHKAEQLIIFIGVGNYLDKTVTTRSERKTSAEVYI